jgi:hypothetical protein
MRTACIWSHIGLLVDVKLSLYLSECQAKKMYGAVHGAEWSVAQPS